MRIDGIGIRPLDLPQAQKTQKPAEQSFGDVVKDAVSKVNEMQTKADDVATRLASGESVEIHQAMIAMQKASTALQFTVQVRNKIIEAYQEIMRMQV